MFGEVAKLKMSKLHARYAKSRRCLSHSGVSRGTCCVDHQERVVIWSPAREVDGSWHNRVGSPSTSDSQAPHWPASHPRRGRS